MYTSGASDIIKLVKKARLFTRQKLKHLGGQEKLPQEQVQCLACQRYCQIASGKVGFCQTRLNKNGQLYALTYGILNGIQVDPIEKKPLYHFYPGTSCLSIGSYGCNYRCKQCLNWHCSWGFPSQEILKKLSFLSSDPGTSRGKPFRDRKIKPEEVVNLAVKKNIPGIAFTYNEPSIWPEYVYDCAKLAKEKGFYTVFVTNGSWSKECLEYLAPVIDACNIDIKGFYPETYQKMGAFFGQILEVTQLVVKKYKIFTELTTLIIPTINDSEKELKTIARWIVKNLGPEIPWHLSRFDPELAPDQQFQKLPTTPIETLKKAYNIGKKAGLYFVYVWAPPKKWTEELFSISDTFCPQCGKLIIKRSGWQPELVGIKKIEEKVNCQFCQTKLNLIL